MRLRQGLRDILLIALVVLAVTMWVMCFCNVARGAEHHKNLVRVQCDSGDKTALGWGVYCEHRGIQGVLTAAHVVEEQLSGKSEATVIFFDGLRLVAHVVTDKYGHDVAFVTVAHPTLRPVLFSRSPPVVRQRVEFVWRKQPKYQLCSEIGTVAQVDRQGMACWGISAVVGDSGSPYFDMNHQVIGVLMLAEPGDRSFPPSVATDYKQTLGFLNRIVQGCSDPSECVSGSCVPQGYRRIQIGPLAPTKVTPPSRPLVPVKVPAVESFDYDKLANLVYAKIEANKEQFRGPAGAPGIPGIPGLPGDSGMAGTDGVSSQINYEYLTEEVLKRLPSQVLEIHSDTCPCSFCVELRQNPKPFQHIWKYSKPLGEPIRLGSFPTTESVE